MAKPLWRGQLFVHQIESEAKYKDVVRVPQSTFRDAESQKPTLNKNQVYKLSTNGKTILVALRGSYKPGICMDQAMRERFGIAKDRSYHFNFHKAGFLGQFLWAWAATDPAYRIATRLGALSLLLGAIGTLLGVWSLYLTLYPH